jgi:signal transduction histidine kinase
MARILAARVNRPLEELAEQTARINLDRLDETFATDRADEIGSLSRVLDTMLKRMRSSVQQLRAAERRAAMGDLARQINHDIRNGLLPIRNVIQHLTEVAHDSPEQLSTVFGERASTLQGSVGYLETLAGNYARLSPSAARQNCDVNAIARTVARAAAVGNQARLQLDLSEASPRVAADPVALRRVVENLTVNALESLPDGTGSVTVATTMVDGGSDRRVEIRVTDTGSGIEPAALERIFDDFFTTRERGTGLGLSIVRRLVTDLGGRIRVSSQPGRGSTFTVELPAL